MLLLLVGIRYVEVVSDIASVQIDGNPLRLTPCQTLIPRPESRSHRRRSASAQESQRERATSWVVDRWRSETDLPGHLVGDVGLCAAPAALSGKRASATSHQIDAQQRHFKE